MAAFKLGQQRFLKRQSRIFHGDDRPEICVAKARQESGIELPGFLRRSPRPRLFIQPPLARLCQPGKNLVQPFALLFLWERQQVQHDAMVCSHHLFDFLHPRYPFIKGEDKRHTQAGARYAISTPVIGRDGFDDLLGERIGVGSEGRMVFVNREVLDGEAFDAEVKAQRVDRAGAGHPPDAFHSRSFEDVIGTGAVDAKDFRSRRRCGVRIRRQVDNRFRPMRLLPQVVEAGDVAFHVLGPRQTILWVYVQVYHTHVVPAVQQTRHYAPANVARAARY